MPPGSHINSDSDLESVISTQELKLKRRRISTGPKYYCSIQGCAEFFKRLDHLDRHEYHHTGIKKHACHYEGCDKTYSIVTHLKRHLRCTHERTVVPAKTVRCSIESCDKLFQSESNMQRHIREVHQNPKVYNCEHCGEKFTQRLKMRRHEIQKHTQQHPFNCAKCKKGFYQQWQYDRHVGNCKIYQCSQCPLHFDKWTLYIKHCKEQQHGRQYYKCEQCTRVYTKPGELQKHIAAKHLPEDDALKMIYKCTTEGCERSYAYERNLRQHQLTAHAGKRFECEREGCERFFSSGQNLQKHIERDHATGSSKREKKATHNDEKKPRKKRKDAGQTQRSHLAALSGLAVDKELDKMLRLREPNAMEQVAEELEDAEEMIEDNDDNKVEDSLEVEKSASDEDEVMPLKIVTKITPDTMQLNTLLSIALNDD